MLMKANLATSTACFYLEAINRIRLAKQYKCRCPTPRSKPESAVNKLSDSFVENSSCWDDSVGGTLAQES